MDTLATTDNGFGPQTLRAVWPAMVGLSAVFLVEMLDNSMLNVALPTIGRDLGASNTALQWVTGAFAVVFGALMLFFGSIADRFGRRRMMFVGLAVLTLASLATIFVRTAGELIVVRAVMGVAAAMTAPGTMAMAFRLFKTENLRLRATTVISTVGLAGMAVGPTVGGLLLAVVPWQALLVINAPIAVLSAIAIRAGIPADTSDELHPDPIDIAGAVLGTLGIALTLVTPTLLVEQGRHAFLPWVALVAAAAILTGFALRERSAPHPLLDFGLLARPLVSAGLAYEIAFGLAMAGLSYTVTLQLQLAWNWSPAQAAVGMFPLILTMLAIGPFVERIVGRLGSHRAATYGSILALSGLALYGLLGRFDYVWVALALVMLSAGGRVVMTVAALSVMGGLPEERTSMGAAMSDTASEVSNAIGIAVTGTVIAAVFVGNIAQSPWTRVQVTQFENAASVAVLSLAAVAALLIATAYLRMRGVRSEMALEAAD